jgi:hypothetical protein
MSNQNVKLTIPLQISISLGQPVILESGGTQVRKTRTFSFESAEVRGFKIESLTEDGFEWQSAYSTVLASNLAYADREEVESTAIQSWGFEECQYVESGRSQCFFAASSKVILIAFRGTDSVRDWIGNINVLGEPREYGTAHRGFLQAFQLLQPQLETLIERFPSVPVVLTGHSLGGAMAVLAAAEWQGNISNPIQKVYTFGQPAVGKAGFAEFISANLAGKIFRFVNNDDVVPKVPPRYEHVGVSFKFDANGEVEVSESLEAVARVSEQPMLTESQMRRMQQQLNDGPASMEALGLFGFSFSDHAIARYLELVESKVL